VGDRRRGDQVTHYRGRRAASIDNGTLRVTVLEEGGHIAEIRDLASGVNPLWTPPWPSIEPSAYDAARDTVYGGTAESSLLAGIMGHNLCLDIFGGPSAEEAAAGMPVHGETSVARFAVSVTGQTIAMHATLPAAQLRIERRIALDARRVQVTETVENLSAADRPVGWTQHATIGPPFLENGVTELHVPADRSLVYPAAFGASDYLVPGAEFAWPHAPRLGGGTADLRVYSSSPASAAYTAHRLDPARDEACVIAFSRKAGLAFGYAWRRADFPWLGLWEENRSRAAAPWNSETRTWGLEFGVSPLPESRRAMIERGRTFDTAGFRWIPARQRVEVRYRAVLRPAASLPASLE
jgi:hypothetical protein